LPTAFLVKGRLFINDCHDSYPLSLFSLTLLEIL
jgi:hypothetical protein